MTEFADFPKMARYSREVIVTEKIDGTNAQICITEDGQFLTGSRTRWITPENDNFGFAKWANENRDELMRLGVGRHFGNPRSAATARAALCGLRWRGERLPPRISRSRPNRPFQSGSWLHLRFTASHEGGEEVQAKHYQRIKRLTCCHRLFDARLANQCSHSENPSSQDKDKSDPVEVAHGSPPSVVKGSLTAGSAPTP